MGSHLHKINGRRRRRRHRRNFTRLRPTAILCLDRMRVKQRLCSARHGELRPSRISTRIYRHWTHIRILYTRGWRRRRVLRKPIMRPTFRCPRLCLHSMLWRWRLRRILRVIVGLQQGASTMQVGGFKLVLQKTHRHIRSWMSLRRGRLRVVDMCRIVRCRWVRPVIVGHSRMRIHVSWIRGHRIRGVV